MTLHYLSLPSSFPGYCFLSDQVIAKVLGLLLPLPSLLSEWSAGWKFVRTIRERLGLRKAEILVRELQKLRSGDWLALAGERKIGVLRLKRHTPVPPKL
jgi:hypothetical protein